MKYKIGTKEKPMLLKTPPLSSEYTMHTDEKDGKTVVKKHACTVKRLHGKLARKIINKSHPLIYLLDTSFGYYGIVPCVASTLSLYLLSAITYFAI